MTGGKKHTKDFHLEEKQRDNQSCLTVWLLRTVLSFILESLWLTPPPPSTGQCTTKCLFLVVPQSKARLLKHWKDSISMPMSASLIYSQKPAVDHKSNHKRQNLPGIQTNPLRLVRTLSSFRDIPSYAQQAPFFKKALMKHRKYISC